MRSNRAEQAGVEPSVRGFRDRFEASPLALHVVLLACLVIAVVPLVRPSVVWTSDEGAIRLQAVTLESGEGWYLERPFSEIDPEEVTSPIQASTVRGNTYAPFTKHVWTPLAIVATPGSAEGWTALVPAVLFGLIAAAGIALVTGLVERRWRNYAMWVAGIGTPVFFYSLTVLSHTAAVAVAGAAAFALVKFLRSSTWAWWIVAVGAVFVGPFMRRESALFAIAVGIGLFVVGSGWRMQKRLPAALGLLVAGLAGVLANERLSQSLVGDPSLIEGDRPFLSVERIVGGASSGLALFDGVASVHAVWVVAMVLGTIVLCYLIGFRSSSVVAIRVAAGAVIVGSLGVAIFDMPGLTGAIVAMPWLLGAMFTLRADLLGRTDIRFLLVSGGLYVLGVLATQERHAGGAGWGGRYLMIGLPLLVPVAVVALGRAMERLQPRVLRPALVAFAFVLVMSIVVVPAVLNRGRTTVVDAQTDWRDAANELGHDGAGHGPVMLSPDSQLGRFGWRLIDEVDFFMIPTDLEQYVARYAAQEPDSFIYMGDWDGEIATLFAAVGYFPAGPGDTSGPVELTTVVPTDG